MSSTKSAIVALIALTVVIESGPAWWQAIKAVAHLVALGYLAWYLWRGPDFVEERRESGTCRCRHHHLSGYDASGGQR